MSEEYEERFGALERKFEAEVLRLQGMIATQSQTIEALQQQAQQSEEQRRTQASLNRDQWQVFNRQWERLQTAHDRQKLEQEEQATIVGRLVAEVHHHRRVHDTLWAQHNFLASDLHSLATVTAVLSRQVLTPNQIDSATAR